MKNSETPTHLFLTGEKQVGKSTLVSSVLDSTKLRYKGLRSISVFDDNNDRNVFIIPAGAGNSSSGETRALVGICSNHHIVEKRPEVFDKTGCHFLETEKDTELIVIDEIGNIERDAKIYSERIMSLLKRTDIRILGVVQKMANTELADAIRNHPNVRMIAVDKNNRDELVQVVLKILQS